MGLSVPNNSGYLKIEIKIKAIKISFLNEFGGKNRIKITLLNPSLCTCIP
jgi:hypothetical protein